MKLPDERKKLREYILSEISDEERSAIEERLMTDDDYFQELSIVEEDLIQDYVDGNLDAAEQAKFEKRFLISEENRQKVKFARALRKYVNETSYSPEPQKKLNFFDSLKVFFSSPVTAALAVLIVLSVAGFFVWQRFSSNDSEVLVALNKAYRTERPIESRITDLNYAPMKNTRGANDSDKTNKIERQLARELALKAASENPTAENLHTLGRVHLTEKNFAGAVEEFEKAVRLAPDSAKLRNDYGVALMEKAKTLEEGKLETFARANEEFAKAIELDKNLLDAYFNQALAIQASNYLPNQAKEAWQKYLELDSTSKWAEEARENLKLIETHKPISKTKEEVLQDFLETQKASDKDKAWQILSRNRGLSSGKLIQQQLAFLFVDSKAIGDEVRAEAALDALIYAGKLEEEKSRDLFWQDLAKYYRNVSKDRIPQLKQAKDRYFQTVLASEATIKKGDYKKSITELEEAQKFYLKAGNNLEPKLIDFLLGYLINRDTKILESTEKLKTLAEFSRKAGYKWLEGQAVTWLAANDIAERKFSQAQLKVKTALALSKETDDLLGQQKNFAQISEIYFLMGQFEKSFNHIEKNLELGELPEASLNERWRALNSISRYFYKLKRFNSTVIFEKEALDFAIELGDKTFEFTSLVDLGVTYSALGDFDNALNLIEKGRAISETFSDIDYKNKCIAHTNLQLGHLKRQKGLFSEAREHYQKASDYYDSGDFQVFSYDAHRGILLSALGEKNDYKFQSELPRILDIFKKYRSEILEEQNRNSFFDNEQDVYDIAVDYEFGSANYANAFDYAEESRSRSLLDLQNSAAQVSTDEKQPEIKFANLSEPLKLAQIQAEMPADTMLLVYSLLPEKVLVWVVTKNNLNTAKIEISAEKLEEKVINYLELVSKNERPEKQLVLSKELYQILISSVKNKLDADKQIFIVPDKVLFRLPFATLYSEKYLVEEYKISYSPSANVFLNCSRKAKEFLEKTPENLLSVGNPTFNQAEYENSLQLLPSAKSEAEKIGEQYENSLVLTEAAATKENVKTHLKKADIFHFAGHYVVEEKTPLLSSLVLAGNKKEESNLANYEIIGEKLSHLRMIVLSACDTGIEKYYKGEGMIGASRTFLALNVPLVVASQWSVDSESTKKLMIRFHQLRKTEKLSTAEALRQSQLEMIKDERFNQPYYWAAFATLGGYTQF